MIEILFRKCKGYFKIAYPNLEVKYFKRTKKWYFKCLIKNSFGVFSKGIRVDEEEDYSLVKDKLNSLEKALIGTATYHFYKKNGGIK